MHMQELAAVKYPDLMRERKLATKPFLSTLYEYQGKEIHSVKFKIKSVVLNIQLNLA